MRRARVEEECEVLGTHSDWCPSVQMFHSLTMLKEVNSPSRRVILIRSAVAAVKSRESSARAWAR